MLTNGITFWALLLIGIITHEYSNFSSKEPLMAEESNGGPQEAPTQPHPVCQQAGSFFEVWYFILNIHAKS